jgi:hypothetical protein
MLQVLFIIAGAANPSSFGYYTEETQTQCYVYPVECEAYSTKAWALILNHFHLYVTFGLVITFITHKNPRRFHTAKFSYCFISF